MTGSGGHDEPVPTLRFRVTDTEGNPTAGGFLTRESTGNDLTVMKLRGANGGDF